MKRLLIAGPRTGVGKTTITLGVLAGLRDRGLPVQPYKVGPDYIDLSLHAALTRRPCYNLDGWMMPGEQMAATFARAARGLGAGGVAVVEGMMGLYDGVGSGDEGGSSADIARRLDLPVVMVLDVGAMAGSAGAAAMGYRDFDSDLDFRGVILNRVAGEHHAAACRAALDRAGIEVVGAVPLDPGLQMRGRHLGLVPAWEESGADLEGLAQKVASHLDIDRLIEIADGVGPFEIGTGADRPASDATHRPVRIGVARDQAFGFYYQDTLEALVMEGAELITFAPTDDEALPLELAGLYLGGGFPEQHLNQLEANVSLREEIRARAADGMPIYAECGGLMYLCRSISADDQPRAMVGVLDGHVRMGGRQAVAYVEVEAIRDTPLMPAGTRLRGHVFHNSVIERIAPSATLAYQLDPGPGIVDRADGWLADSVLASYAHLPLAAHPELVRRWLDACRSYRPLTVRD